MRVTQDHKIFVHNQIADAQDEGRPLPPTKVLVDALMQGIPEVRKPLPRAAANNVVQAVRKELGLYKAKTGEAKKSTDWQHIRAMREHREAVAAHNAAATASAEVKHQNEIETVEAEEAPQEESLEPIMMF